MELFVNSGNVDFIKRIEEKYETLDELEQGMIMYPNISFENSSNMSNVVITSLHDLIKKFSKDGITKVPDKKIGPDSENEICVSA